MSAASRPPSNTRPTMPRYTTYCIARHATPGNGVQSDAMPRSAVHTQRNVAHHSTAQHRSPDHTSPHHSSPHGIAPHRIEPHHNAPQRNATLRQVAIPPHFVPHHPAPPHSELPHMLPSPGSVLFSTHDEVEHLALMERYPPPITSYCLALLTASHFLLLRTRVTPLTVHYPLPTTTCMLLATRCCLLRRILGTLPRRMLKDAVFR